VWKRTDKAATFGREGFPSGPPVVFLFRNCWDGRLSPRKRVVIFQKRVARLSEPTLRAFLLRAKKAVKLKGTVNLLLTSSTAMRSLNRQFRAKDVPTDVLSFPSPSLPLNPPTAGDIAISVDIAAQNATKLGHSTAEEVKILVLHGILHLAGFDHERDNGQMARKEATLRQTLRLPVALIERDKSERDKIQRSESRTTRVPERKSVKQRPDKASARRRT
jgi:probable rRNA maturation factor